MLRVGSEFSSISIEFFLGGSGQILYYWRNFSLDLRGWMRNTVSKRLTCAAKYHSPVRRSISGRSQANQGADVINICCAHAGTVAVVTVFILERPELEIVNVGRALEWLFYLLLPNFSFNKALQDMYSNYQYGKICHQYEVLLAQINKTKAEYCRVYVQAYNSSNVCCPGDFTVRQYHAWFICCSFVYAMT